MPLPKIPTKPAALLLAKDYPKASDRNKPAAVQAIPAAKPSLAAVADAAPDAVIAKAAPKSTRSKATPAAPAVAAVPSAAPAALLPVPAPAVAEAPLQVPAAKPAARGKEKQPV